MTDNKVLQVMKALDDLADVQAELDLLNIQKQANIDALIPENIKVAIALKEAEYSVKLLEISTAIDVLKGYIEQVVLELGVTVKGKYKMAVFQDGRITWNGKELAGFFKTMPELASKFSKKGKPGVVIRNI